MLREFDEAEVEKSRSELHEALDQSVDLAGGLFYAEVWLALLYSDGLTIECNEILAPSPAPLQYLVRC